MSLFSKKTKSPAIKLITYIFCILMLVIAIKILYNINTNKLDKFDPKKSIVKWASNVSLVGPHHIVEDSNDYPFDLEMSLYSDNDPYNPIEERVVKTCGQWEKAVHDGFGPKNNLHVAKSSFFISQCGPYILNKRASKPKHSFVQYYFSEDSPNHLPPTMSGLNLSNKEMVEAVKAQNKRISWKEHDLSLTIETISNLNMSVKVDGGFESFSIVAWSDFDGDGFEDIALYRASYTTGSYKNYGYILLSKTSDQGIWTIKDIVI